MRHDASDSSLLDQELLSGNPVERCHPTGAGPAEPVYQDSLRL
jgi:hypothetical protein